MACLVAPEVQIFLYAEIADEQLASSMELLMDGFADTCRSIYGALFAGGVASCLQLPYRDASGAGNQYNTLPILCSPNMRNIKPHLP
ncbi:hypothetical protein DAI22_08g204900 [Oryza sativa Japonica Group]|nr:hypothetical protein DAI22_08g204900 [Oryza sativa Japonica Group]